jgi:hypothetical protein
MWLSRPDRGRGAWGLGAGCGLYAAYGLRLTIFMVRPGLRSGPGLHNGPGCAAGRAAMRSHMRRAGRAAARLATRPNPPPAPAALRDVPRRAGYPRQVRRQAGTSYAGKLQDVRAKSDRMG